ncbi:SAM-dependent methyltransferase, partial [Pseudoalteromonas sp. S3173]
MEKVSSLSVQERTSWITNLYKKLVFKAFSSIETGQIVLVDNNKQSVFGDTSSELKLKLNLNETAMY